MNEKESSQLVSELYESLYSPLLRYVTHATGSLEISEEVVQEAFTRLYQQLRRGRHIENPKAWTYCVARREMANRMRETRLFGTRAPLADLDNLASPQFPPPYSVETDEVGRLLSILSAREAEVVLLRLGNLKYREIGEELGISTKSVGTLLARALWKLRHALTGATRGESARVYVETQSPKPLQ